MEKKKKPFNPVKVLGTVAATLLKYVSKIATYLFNVVMTLVLIFVVTGSIVAAVFAIYIKNYIDPTFDIENLKFDSDLTTFLYYQEEKSDGTVEWVEYEEERIHGSENRMWVKYDDMPSNLVNAFVAIEDKRFFTHPGIDFRRTVGAVLGFITGDDSYGGSTITMQLIKNVTGENEVRLQRKIQEILRALDLEKRRSKEEIIEMYLNTIYLSQGTNGVQAAAHVYFGKDVSELSLVECAALASIPQSPTKWDPVQNPGGTGEEGKEGNKERRIVVLQAMYEQGLISEAECDAAQAADLVLATDPEESKESVIHNWFVDAVIDEFLIKYMEKYNCTKEIASKMLYSGGLQIYTTMDKDIQDTLEYVFESDNYFPDTETAGVKPEAAMVIMDHTNGDVLGLVGGRGEKTVPRGFNLATHAKRQPGSAIKPLSVYSPAIELGLITYATQFDDVPLMYYKAYKRMWPSNSPATYIGLTNVNYGLTQSKNTVATRIMEMLTPQTSYDFLTEKYKIGTLVESLETSTGEIKTDINIASLAMGGLTYGARVIDMTTAYCAFPNNGVFNHYRLFTKVLDNEGNVILSDEEDPEIILSEETTSIMNIMLENVVKKGTAKSLTLSKKVQCAGKTGTTSSRNDLYYAGYTPYYTAAVWFGYSQPVNLPSYTQSPALYLWDIVMNRVHQDIIDEAQRTGEPLKTFDISTKIVTAEYCKDSGKLATENCKLDLRGNRIETGYFTRTTVPKEYCDCHKTILYCNDSNCVAGPNCPDTKTVALVETPYRKFEKNVWVTDAEYTYMELPEGYVYPSTTDVPYYANLYPSDRFMGLTRWLDRAPRNSFCVHHNSEYTVSKLPYDRPPDEGDPDAEPGEEGEEGAEATEE
ncbi:MAG: transglycosylase [Ruminococcaceae bacterium]|nr:transglycosylase [Oscillospiraceae bacterium]